MKKIKSPLKSIFEEIQIEKDDLREMITLRIYQIHNLTNDFTIHPMDKYTMIKQNHEMLNFWKNQLKILKEKEIIISSA